MTDAAFPPAMMPCIQSFFQEVHPTLKPGQDSYPEVFQSSLFFPLQRRREMEKMMQVARQANGGNPQVVMEIGADKGGSLYHWCMCLPTVNRVIACEIRGTPYRALFEQAFPQMHLLWLEQSSYESRTVATVKDWLSHSGYVKTSAAYEIDILFIDGDKGHFYDDFVAYLPMMRKPGGVVLFHDVQDPGLMRDHYFEALHHPAARQGHIILDVSEAAEACSRQAQGIPATCEHENWLRRWKGRSCGVGVVEL